MPVNRVQTPRGHLIFFFHFSQRVRTPCGHLLFFFHFSQKYSKFCSAGRIACATGYSSGRGRIATAINNPGR